ncbi:extracellular solute-binding protein [Reyranella sp.]|uniref:extracellular solute-binding protein n=1 Tax=Reyranella sp. TaxID=1929291 RepID=UPI003784A789
MAIKRRNVLAGGAALWLAAPTILRAQTSAGTTTSAGTVVSHGFATHGDLKYPADAKALEYANPAALKGGEIRLAGRGTFDSLNPFILKGTPAAAVGQIYESLMSSPYDEAATSYGLIAETIEYPKDRAWAVFTLRPQARWHDGKPITADDVVFSFDMLKSKGAPQYAAYWQNVAKAERIDERVVKFTFSGGENVELPQIIGQLTVLPKHWWATRDFEKTSLEIPLGSGPYRVDSFEAGRYITIKRVPDAWAKDVWLNQGRHNFDTMRYDYYRDETVAFEAFKAGEVDYREEYTSRNWAVAYDIPAVKSGLIQRATLKHESTLPMQCLGFNLRRELFKDRRVREAFVNLVDFEWFNKTLSYGLLTRVNSYFFNSELAATGLPSKEELEVLEPLRGQVPDEVFAKEFKLPVTDGSGNNRDGARRAIALFKEAGWEIRNGKMTNKAGQPFSFEMLLGEPRMERFALPFKQWAEKVGVDVRVRTVDPAQYQKRMDDFDYDMTIELFMQSLSPGNEQREFWGSQAAGIKGSRNTIGIADPAVDKLIELVISAPDRKSLIMRTRALDRVLLWHHYVVPQYYSTEFWIAYWNKFGRPEKLAKYQPRGLATWWIDPDKEKALRSATGKS